MLSSALPGRREHQVSAEEMGERQPRWLAWLGSFVSTVNVRTDRKDYSFTWWFSLFLFYKVSDSLDFSDLGKFFIFVKIFKKPVSFMLGS